MILSHSLERPATVTKNKATLIRLNLWLFDEVLTSFNNLKNRENIMKKLTLIVAAVFSINTFAITTEQSESNNMKAEISSTKNTIDLKANVNEFLKKPSLNVPGLISSVNPSCAKNCQREFNACLDAGFPWNSCNWDFQACADICFPNPIDC